MKWAYAIGQKMKAAILLAIVFILVLVKNISDKHQLTALGDTFSSVYEDRLVVESYIYSLSDHLYQKKLLTDRLSSGAGSDEVQTALAAHNEAIGQLVASYGKTKLTPEESAAFTRLRGQLAEMAVLESRAFERSSGQDLTPVVAKINSRFVRANVALQQLSRIQVAEGRLLNEQSRQRIAGASLRTELELVVLIGIGIMIQGILFASRSLATRPTHQASLN